VTRSLAQRKQALSLSLWFLSLLPAQIEAGVREPLNEKEYRYDMSDTPVSFAISAVQLPTKGQPGGERSTIRSDKLAKAEESASAPRYLATSPCGASVNIPRELFVALHDFISSRKCPGSITIQFRRGEIVCVEAVAKKTYRNP
jgi:hypothetical protein